MRAKSHYTCLQHTQSLVALCQELGCLVNREKSEMVPKQVFNFIGSQFDLKEGRVLHRSTHSNRKTSPKEGWGAPLNERTARGTWSLPESKLHINHLELKAVFLALKEFQDLCLNNIVLVATDSTVVAYINKEGGMKSGPLGALQLRILTWCSRRRVTLKA